MTVLIIIVALALVLQVVLFFMIRAKKKQIKEQSVEFKYGIKSVSDAWRMLNDPNLPDADREEIQHYYQSELKGQA